MRAEKNGRHIYLELPLSTRSTSVLLFSAFSHLGAVIADRLAGFCYGVASDEGTRLALLWVWLAGWLAFPLRVRSGRGSLGLDLIVGRFFFFFCGRLLGDGIDGTGFQIKFGERR